MIVIPMAGLSRRFSEAGYRQPKYMLSLHGRTLFAHAVDSFRAYFKDEPFLFIARSEQGTADFVQSEIDALGLAEARVVILDQPTKGQAETVQIGLDKAAVDPATSLTIFNIDTFRPGFAYPETAWMWKADGYLEVMGATDPGYSYARPVGGIDESRVEMTAEKQVISDLASTGLYWFRHASDFSQAFEAAQAANLPGELYVAPLYNKLIAQGRDIRYHRVSDDEVIFCGTPAQYEGLLSA